MGKNENIVSPVKTPQARKVLNMKCNYNRKQNNSIPRWAVTMVDGELKEVPVTEEEYVEGYFEQYGIEIVTPKDKLINALKQGDYVIGVDYNPFVLQDVFHYENGRFEFLKFADVGIEVMAPLRLKREQTLYLPASHPNVLDALIKGMAHYDDFIVCRKGHLLDTENIPLSMLDMIQESINNK